MKQELHYSDWTNKGNSWTFTNHGSGNGGKSDWKGFHIRSINSWARDGDSGGDYQERDRVFNGSVC